MFCRCLAFHVLTMCAMILCRLVLTVLSGSFGILYGTSCFRRRRILRGVAVSTACDVVWSAWRYPERLRGPSLRHVWQTSGVAGLFLRGRRAVLEFRCSSFRQTRHLCWSSDDRRSGFFPRNYRRLLSFVLSATLLPPPTDPNVFSARRNANRRAPNLFGPLSMLLSSLSTCSFFPTICVAFETFRLLACKCRADRGESFGVAVCSM